MLSDNGTEFKNKMFEQLSKELWARVQTLYPTISSSLRMAG